MNRQILLQTLNGYAEVNHMTEAERRSRLRQRTDQESLEIYAELYQTWEDSSQREVSDTSRIARL